MNSIDILNKNHLCTSPIISFGLHSIETHNRTSFNRYLSMTDLQQQYHTMRFRLHLSTHQSSSPFFISTEVNSNILPSAGFGSEFEIIWLWVVYFHVFSFHLVIFTFLFQFSRLFFSFCLLLALLSVSFDY